MNDGSRAVEIFLRYLKVEGCKVVFGIPGGLLFPFFEAVEQDEDLSLVVTRHEEGAAFMADGYARTGGKLAVCAATSGPGATNLITGVACAFTDGVPMLVVTGQAATRGIGKGAAQETGREDIDIVAMFRPITKYSAMVSDATCLAHHLRRALRLAFSGRPGPVHLNVPVEVWERSVEESWMHPPSYRPSAQVFDPLATARAADALLAASHPVILAGSGVGVARAEALLARIANLLPARVATTPRGKGLFPEDHPLSLGVLGFGGHRDARAAVLENPCVDVLFTVGASLNETTTFNWDARLARGKTLIQLDIDPDRVGRNYAVDVALVGDAEATLGALADTLEARVSTSRSGWGNAPPLVRGHARYTDEVARIARTEPLTPQRWRAELQQVLPPDALLFSDIGGHMLFNVHHLCISAGQRFVLNLGFGSMGHGTAAPIGAALAHPGRPVFAIIGDACFTMNGMELITAVQYEVPVTWIVENNNMHGITWHGSQLLGSRRPLTAATYRQRVDVATMARGMGVQVASVVAPGQLCGAVREALAMRRPALIDIHVDPSIAPPVGERVQTITGFTDK